MKECGEETSLHSSILFDASRGECVSPFRGERSVAALPAGRSPSPAGWVGGRFTPPHRFKARTAASDGLRAFTRAARSAGLNFAVILLSKAMDVGRDHLIHR